MRVLRFELREFAIIRESVGDCGGGGGSTLHLFWAATAETIYDDDDDDDECISSYLWFSEQPQLTIDL